MITWLIQLNFDPIYRIITRNWKNWGWEWEYFERCTGYLKLFTSIGSPGPVGAVVGTILGVVVVVMVVLGITIGLIACR